MLREVKHRNLDTSVRLKADWELAIDFPFSEFELSSFHRRLNYTQSLRITTITQSNTKLQVSTIESLWIHKIVRQCERWNNGDWIGVYNRDMMSGVMPFLNSECFDFYTLLIFKCCIIQFLLLDLGRLSVFMSTIFNTLIYLKMVLIEKTIFDKMWDLRNFI